MPEHRADVLVVVEHCVVVRALPTAGLPDALGLRVRAEVDVGEFTQRNHRLAGDFLALQEVNRSVGEVVVNRPSASWSADRCP
jgi:hypothetical protein